MGFDMDNMLETASSSNAPNEDSSYKNDLEDTGYSENEYGYESDDEEYYDESDYDDEPDYDPEIRDLILELIDAKEKLDTEAEAAKAQKKYYEKKSKKKPRGLFDSSVDPEMRGKPLLDRLGYDREAKANKKPSLAEKIIDRVIRHPKVRVLFYAILGIAGLALGIFVKFFI